MKLPLGFILLIMIGSMSYSQSIDEDQLGAWYMYAFNTTFKESQFGLQGDFQYRDFQGLGDREQLLLRTGFTFAPKDSNVKFTLGYANVSTGTYGTQTDAITLENRIYQEALLSNTILKRVYITHRFRYEQRWVENQNLRTRYRYNLFINVPVNKKTIEKNAIYVAFSNELFLNGEREIQDDVFVSYFDRNRAYFGLGYALNNRIRFQAGWMEQTTSNLAKDQIQLSMLHTF